jgi:hypothetical protein
MDSKIETGVPYSFTFIRELFGNNSLDHEKAVAHLATKRVTVLWFDLPRILVIQMTFQLKPAKLIHFNIENM